MTHEEIHLINTSYLLLLILFSDYSQRFWTLIRLPLKLHSLWLLIHREVIVDEESIKVLVIYNFIMRQVWQDKHHHIWRGIHEDLEFNKRIWWIQGQ